MLSRPELVCVGEHERAVTLDRLAERDGVDRGNATQLGPPKRGVAVPILPVDISKTEVSDGAAFAVHRAAPLLRPSDAELDRIAPLLNAGTKIAIYGGSDCDGAHDEIIALADLLKAPVAHTSRAKDFLEDLRDRSVGLFGMGMRLSPGDAFVHEPGVQLVVALDAQARREEALADEADLVLNLAFLPARRRGAGDRIDEMMGAHLEEAAIVLPLLRRRSSRPPSSCYGMDVSRFPASIARHKGGKHGT